MRDERTSVLDVLDGFATSRRRLPDVARALLRYIDEEDVDPRLPLPSLTSLAVTFEVARPCMKRALALLAQHGVLRAVRGQYFVAGSAAGRVGSNPTGQTCSERPSTTVPG